MKKNLFFLLLILAFAINCANSPQPNTQASQTTENNPKTETKAEAKAENKTEATTQTAQTNNDVVKRGAPLGNATAIPVVQVLENPKAYEGKTLTVEGKIARVCQEKGCWLELTEKEGDPGLRITFKDYGFFVPTDSQGKKVKAEGIIELKTLKKDVVDHLISDGSKMKQKSDGTADIVGLVASGVELYKN